MSSESVERNTRLVQALNEILDNLAFDTDDPVKVLKVRDGREVVIAQASAFTILCMYVKGRPDGKRPHGRDSYADYFYEQLEDYKQQHGSDEGFQLTPEDWRTLFDESYDRYMRYFFFATIKRWADVKQDTDTNLSVMALAKKYAPESVAWQSYQYKGYVLMMNSIAAAELCLKANDRQGGLAVIDESIQRIGQFCAECLRDGHGEAENITRERYLSNLIEFRSDLESVEDGLSRRRGHAGNDDDEFEDGDEFEDDDSDILEELEELLNGNEAR